MLGFGAAICDGKLLFFAPQPNLRIPTVLTMSHFAIDKILTPTPLLWRHYCGDPSAKTEKSSVFREGEQEGTPSPFFGRFLPKNGEGAGG